MRIPWGLACGLLLSATVSRAITGAEVLQQIRRTYERTTSFQAEFDQTFDWKLAGTVQEMHGRFLMKKPNSFRIETDVQTVVTDGKTVWSYSPATEQVIVNDYDPSAMPLRPDNFLFSFPDERHISYVGEEQFSGARCHVIEIVPQDSTLGIETMRAWVDGRTWMAKKVQYTSISRDVTTYVLKDVTTNPDLRDSSFRFSIPEGTDVVDFRAR
jgi:outer membrane lipoprotein carrier protein